MPILGTSASQNTKSFLKPVVTGGTLTSDSTYYYRTFTATGDLVVSGSSLTADVLMIGAGGACYSPPTTSPNGTGGGGGAGGAVYGTGRTITPSTYAVVIGAGGSNSGGTNGNDSTFNSIISKGGGGFSRGAGDIPVSNPGGCGAGANAYFNNNPPFTNTSNQQSFSGYTSYGNRGGRNSVVDSYTEGKIAGGGGIGGVVDFGGGPGNTTEVRGGPGLNTWSSWATVTGTGVSGFYGGGGGGWNGYAGPGAGGSGGGGTAGDPAGSGVANTGSGGGGTNSGSQFGGRTGGNGGSGLFIIRYTKVQVD
jgi:hypothetical protein